MKRRLGPRPFSPPPYAQLHRYLREIISEKLVVFLIKYCLHCSITVDLLPWEQLKIYPVTTCNPRFIVSSNTGERDYGRGRKHSVVCTVSLPSPLLFQPRSPFVSLLRDRPKEGGKSKKGSPTARARAPPICDQLGSPSRMAKAARCRPLARRGWQRRPRRLWRGDRGRSSIIIDRRVARQQSSRSSSFLYACS